MSAVTEEQLTSFFLLLWLLNLFSAWSRKGSWILSAAGWRLPQPSFLACAVSPLYTNPARQALL